MTNEIIVGLITTFLGTLIATTWRSWIMPFIIENFGERIKIHEYWTGNLNFGSGNLHGIKIEIKKLGYNIKGELEFNSGRHTGKKYYIKGRFQANILTFHYHPHDKRSTSQGSATFLRLQDGELLSGHFAYFSQEKNLVDTTDCKLTPIKN